MIPTNVNILALIPQSLRTKALDATVDVIVQWGDEVLDEQMLRKVKGLRSDGAFRLAFDTGLQRAMDRFVAEYVEVDEDLVEAIADDSVPRRFGYEGFFKNQEVQKALLLMLQNPGIYLSEQQQVVAQSFDSVLPRRRNRKRVNRAVNFFLRCLGKEVWHLPELRPIYTAHFQRMTLDGINEMKRLQRAQVEANQALGGDIRAALVALTTAIAEQKLLSQQASLQLVAPSPPVVEPPSASSGTVETRPRLLSLLRQAQEQPKHAPSRHNLPQPDYERFVGRKKELSEVRRLLLPTTRHFVVTIDGVGGVGKSALALEVATGYMRHAEQLPEEERFGAIIWATAKQSVLTGEGIRLRSQSLRTLDDIYSTIAITLEREEITRARSEEQDALVRRALTQQRTLLIIDNLETVDDERVMTFIREVPEPTKVIVTTRHRVDTRNGGARCVAYPIRLVGMSQEEALELIAHEARRGGVRLTKQEAIRLYKRTGGVPLAIVWSVAQMGFGYGVASVLNRLGQPNNDIAKFCFEGAVEPIRDTPAHKLLISLSLFTPDANRQALGIVANLPELDRDDGLVALEKLSLVNRKLGRFSFLPLTKTFATAELERHPDFKKEAGRRWVDYLREISKRPDSEYYWRYSDYSFYDEGTNILEALQWSYAHGTSEDVFELTLAGETCLNFRGDWSNLLRILKEALDLARSIQSPIHIARFTNACGWYSIQKGEYHKAKSEFYEALSYYRKIMNREGEWLSLARLGAIYRKEGNFTQAKIIYDQAWQIAEDLKSGDLKAMQDFEYGKLARDMQDWALAWKYFSKVQKWFEQRTEQTPSDQELARGNWGHLAIVAYHLGRPQEAKELCLRSLEFFKNHGTRAFLATLNYRLALAEEALGEREAALQHAKDALDWFDRLGMRPDYAEAKVLVERLEA